MTAGAGKGTASAAPDITLTYEADKTFVMTLKSCSDTKIELSEKAKEVVATWTLDAAKVKVDGKSQCQKITYATDKDVYVNVQLDGWAKPGGDDTASGASTLAAAAAAGALAVAATQF